MTKFRPGQSAAAAHSALKSATKTMDQAHQNAVLWFGEIQERRLYRDLGFSSINQYAQQALGFSKTRTGDFVQLCGKLEKLPLIKEQVASGQLGYTHARELVKVADENNEGQWLEVANRKSRRELEQEVQRARQETVDRAAGQTTLIPDAEERPAAVATVRVSLEMSPEQYARYEALWEKARNLAGGSSDKVETLLEMMACYIAEKAPRGAFRASNSLPDKDLIPESQSPNGIRSHPAAPPPVQIHIHQCPDCGTARVPTSRGDLPISSSTLERAWCDGQISRPGRRNTTTIPPRIRREVLVRDRHRCQNKGCTHTGHLEVHHLVPRAQGGSNQAENLITLCSGCHQLLHEGKVVLDSLHLSMSS